MCSACRAAPRAPPASCAAGCTKTSSKGLPQEATVERAVVRDAARVTEMPPAGLGGEVADDVHDDRLQGGLQCRGEVAMHLGERTARASRLCYQPGIVDEPPTFLACSK